LLGAGVVGRCSFPLDLVEPFALLVR